jgi:nicotinate-nucleotide adenylyltransferase
VTKATLIGIYGGTFDPIHYGHLRTALEVKEALQLDELRFLPCRLPPHRASPGASPEQRLQMLELALENTGPGFIADDRELRREGPSYMVDTLTSLRQEYPESSLCLIVGLDAFYGLPSWHRWRELFNLAHVVVMRRPGLAEPAWTGDLAELIQQRRTDDFAQLSAVLAGQLVFLEVTQLDISATGIRRLVADKKNPRYLLPDPVLAMIQQQGLYV